MIQPNELRIGNWYSFADYHGIAYRQVKQIKPNEFGLLSDYDGVNFKVCKPIPLTEEWLIKFGFHYSDDDNEFLELELMRKIKLYADNSNNFSTVVLRLKENEIEIKSVHQLQNLYFALAGKELQQKIN